TLDSVSWKVVATVPPWPSSAVTWRFSGVASATDGLPLKVRVAGVKVSHAGRAPPPARVAPEGRGSEASASAEVVGEDGRAVGAVGGSLTLDSASWKVVFAVPPWPSLAVTWILSGVVSVADGLPLKVRVPGVKLSQAGRAPPPTSVAP